MYYCALDKTRLCDTNCRWFDDDADDDAETSPAPYVCYFMNCLLGICDRLDDVSRQIKLESERILSILQSVEIR